MIDPEVKTLITAELVRIAAGGIMVDTFWQRMFDQGGRTAYFAARQQRARDAVVAKNLADIAWREANTVEEKREARKLMKRAKVLKGLQRHYLHDIRTDPLAQAYQIDSKWINDARDAAILMSRWHQSTGIF